MTWGTFGAVHISTLVLSAAIIAGLYFFLRNRSDKVQTAVMGILSLSGIAAMIFNLVAWGSPLEYLPFHLCSLTAIVLPFAVITKSKIANNLLLLWALGAALALVVNTAQADFNVFSWTFFFYYIPHTLEFGLVILSFALKRAELDARCILSTIAITFTVYTAVHCINLAVNSYCVRENILNPDGLLVRVNYMYSLVPENPVLEMLYTKPYFYMFNTIPLIVVYLGVIYAPQIVRLARRKKKLA